MFERFTERAHKAVVLAQEGARCFDHGYVGTEHVLLALVREHKGGTVRVLSDRGIGPEEARREVAMLDDSGVRAPSRTLGAVKGQR